MTDADPATSAKAHIARAAKQDFHRVLSMLKSIETYWRGVRFIIRALDQKAEGIQNVDIAEEIEPLPADLIALLEKASQRPTGDGQSCEV
jgi:hypothetical protein